MLSHTSHNPAAVLAMRYVTSLLEGDEKTVEQCLSSKVQATLVRYDEKFLFNKDEFLHFLQQHHFKHLVSSDIIQYQSIYDETSHNMSIHIQSEQCQNRNGQLFYINIDDHITLQLEQTHDQL